MRSSFSSIEQWAGGITPLEALASYPAGFFF
jgi:hypothetical protein